MVENNVDTIVAMATPPGRGGVGVVRVSGPLVLKIMKDMLGQSLKPRFAHYLAFYDTHREKTLDQGIAIFFENPHSFTGEDVLEFQGHGGPFVMGALIQRIQELGARIARPGEFSERAFIHNKIDLLQAEAVADLINASSEQAARAALRSLQGDFSRLIEILTRSVIHLRMYIEATLDFPEEEIEFLENGHVLKKLQDLQAQLTELCTKAHQGLKLSQSVKVVIAGKPNAGKSSLLNRLSGLEAAIVTHIPGTTRDVIKEEITLGNVTIQLIDTAGLRESTDIVEQEGIKRTQQELLSADHIIWITDADVDNPASSIEPEWSSVIPKGAGLTVLCNKIDVTGASAGIVQNIECGYSTIYASVKTGEGIPLFLTHLQKTLGRAQTTENTFLARQRHVDALQLATRHIDRGLKQLNLGKLEFVAEELRCVQRALDEITGKFTSDDLLGKIFSEFCIGK